MTPLLASILVLSKNCSATLQRIASSMTKPIDHAASPLELLLVQQNMVHDTLVEYGGGYSGGE